MTLSGQRMGYGSGCQAGRSDSIAVGALFLRFDPLEGLPGVLVLGVGGECFLVFALGVLLSVEPFQREAEVVVGGRALGVGRDGLLERLPGLLVLVVREVRGPQVGP